MTSRLVPGFGFVTDGAAGKSRILPGFGFVKDTASGGGGTTFNQSVLASCSPVATLLRSTGKPLAASSAPVATLLRSTGKPLAASSAPAASVVRSTAKPLAASSAPVASLVRQTGKPLKASTSPVATLVALKVVLVGLQAVAAATASLVRGIGKPQQAATGPVATLIRQTAKPLQANTAPVGTIRRAIGKALQATATAIGTLATQFTGAGGGPVVDPLFWLKPLARVRRILPTRIRRLQPTARVRMITAQRGVVKKFSPTTPAGRADCTIDFTSILAGAYSPPVTVSSCVVTCAIHPTSAVPDPTASARCDGAVIVTAGKSVTQFFKDGVAGADYILTFLATLSNGAKEPIDAVQPVRAYNDVGT
jgi:hypothetical protein